MEKISLMSATQQGRGGYTALYVTVATIYAAMHSIVPSTDNKVMRKQLGTHTLPLIPSLQRPRQPLL